MKPSILFIVPAVYDELKAKGVAAMIIERDEGGFFGKVVTLHPFCPATRVISLNETHEVHEIGFDLIPGAGRFRLLKYLQAPVHFFRIIAAAIRLAKGRRISIIRANDPFWMGLFAWITSRISGVPYCVSIHSDYDKRMELDSSISIVKVLGSYALALRMQRFVLGRAAMVMPIRESLAVKAVKQGARPDRIRVIPHGIDLTPFTQPPRTDIFARFGIGAGRRIISFAGRFSKENYLQHMVETIRRLADRRSDFVFVMAGGGKELEPIRSVVSADPKLTEHILLPGFQPREVCNDLRRASMIALCLMGGYSLIESCAAGRPVVAYDVEWHGELVKNGDTGFLVREHDIEGVVSALEYLLDRPAEVELMGSNARRLAFSQHDLAKTSATKVRWYTEFLNPGSADGSAP